MITLPNPASTFFKAHTFHMIADERLKALDENIYRVGVLFATNQDADRVFVSPLDLTPNDPVPSFPVQRDNKLEFTYCDHGSMVQSAWWIHNVDAEGDITVIEILLNPNA